MAEATDTPEEAAGKTSRMPLIAGLVLAAAGAGAGFYATSSGLILGGSPAHEDVATGSHANLPPMVFVPMDVLTISLPRQSSSKHLHFRASLEVPAQYRKDVEAIMPRIIDVMNGYLRALEASDIEDPAALTKLRSQMLRRAQVVAGSERVNDMLIMEFVLN